MVSSVSLIRVDVRVDISKQCVFYVSACFTFVQNNIYRGCSLALCWTNSFIPRQLLGSFWCIGYCDLYVRLNGQFPASNNTFLHDGGFTFLSSCLCLVFFAFCFSESSRNTISITSFLQQSQICFSSDLGNHWCWMKMSPSGWQVFFPGVCSREETASLGWALENFDIEERSLTCCSA